MLRNRFFSIPARGRYRGGPPGTLPRQGSR
jgi:hypothetical protein